MNPLLHRIFDVCIGSELPLPGLRLCEGESPDWTIRCPRGEPDDSAYQWFHTWTSPDGQELMSAARHGENYLLRIFDLAVFELIFSQRRIDAYALEGCTENTMAHLLQDQVLPRVLCHQGRAVIHASAVRLQDGRGVAFSGASGRGKSTLATAFHNAGHQVLCDDCLLLEQWEELVFAISAYPSLRLWPDSLAALSRESNLKDARISDMAHYTSKKQVLIADEDDPGTPPLELAALFLLAEPGEDSADEEIRIEAVAGSAAIMALIEAGFALDLEGKASVQRNFETVGRVANHVPVYKLAYQREFSSLPQVIEKVMNFRF